MKNFKNFIYKGDSVTRFTIIHFGRPLEVCLEPGKAIALPAENSRDLSLVTQRLLVEQTADMLPPLPVSLPNTAELIANPVAEPVTEVVEPVAEVVAEPVTEVVEPVAKVVAEPVTEVVEPVAKVITIEQPEGSPVVMLADGIVQPGAETELFPEAENDETEKMVDHILTEQDIIDNPDLTLQGLKAGDTVQIPEEPTIVEPFIPVTPTPADTSGKGKNKNKNNGKK